MPLLFRIFFSYMQIKKVSIYTNPKNKMLQEQGSEWRKSEYFHCWAAKKSEQAWGLEGSLPMRWAGMKEEAWAKKGA